LGDNGKTPTGKLSRGRVVGVGRFAYMPKLRHDEEEPLKDCTKLDQRKKAR